MSESTPEKPRKPPRKRRARTAADDAAEMAAEELVVDESDGATDSGPHFRLPTVGELSAIVGLIGDGSVLAIIVTVAAGLAAGHWLGRPNPANSNALAVAAAIRHPGIAALIVHANFTDPRVMMAVVLFLLTSVIVSTVYQKLAKRWAGPPLDSAVAT